MDYQVKTVQGHVEVYDQKGLFLFSADSVAEAMAEMQQYQAA